MEISIIFFGLVSGTGLFAISFLSDAAKTSAFRSKKELHTPFWRTKKDLHLGIPVAPVISNTCPLDLIFCCEAKYITTYNQMQAVFIFFLVFYFYVDICFHKCYNCINPIDTVSKRLAKGGYHDFN